MRTWNTETPMIYRIVEERGDWASTDYYDAEVCTLKQAIAWARGGYRDPRIARVYIERLTWNGWMNIQY